MPMASEAAAWHLLTSGICAELTKRPAEAITAYTAFTQLPTHQRLLGLNTPDPEVEWFVRWRLRTLAK